VDPGPLPPGQGSRRAQLRHLTGPLGEGAAGARHLDPRGGEPLPRSGLHPVLEPALRRGARRASRRAPPPPQAHRPRPALRRDAHPYGRPRFHDPLSEPPAPDPQIPGASHPAWTGPDDRTPARRHHPLPPPEPLPRARAGRRAPATRRAGAEAAAREEAATAPAASRTRPGPPLAAWSPDRQPEKARPVARHPRPPGPSAFPSPGTGGAAFTLNPRQGGHFCLNQPADFSESTGHPRRDTHDGLPRRPRGGAHAERLTSAAATPPPAR